LVKKRDFSPYTVFSYKNAFRLPFQFYGEYFEFSFLFFNIKAGAPARYPQHQKHRTS